MSDALDDLELNDDEKQRQPLSPRIAPPNVASGALPPMNLRGLPPPATSEATPATGSTADLENHVATRVIPPPIAKPSPLETRTTADQAELGRLRTTGSGISQVARAHPIAGGILRGLNIAGSVASGLIPGLHPLMNSIPGTEEHHNYLERQATGKIGEDLGEQKDELANTKTEADTDEANARAEQARAEAAKARTPPDKATKPEPVFDKAGNIIGFNTGTDLLGLNNPNLSPDMKAMVDAAQVKPGPAETATQNKEAFQNVVAKVDAAGLPTDEKTLSKSLDAALKAGKITAEEHQAARGYLAANPTPSTNLSVHVAGAQETEGTELDKAFTGKEVIVHNADGSRVQMSYGDAKKKGIPLDQMTILNANEAQQNRDKDASIDATMSSLKGYRNDFKTIAPKLTETDRNAMRVLTDHAQGGQMAGLLGNLFDDIPLAGPMGEYGNKLMRGTMTSDQYNQLTPEGKKLVADYFTQLVANFANMKAVLGSMGRNPAQIQAEINRVPLPYLDWNSANELFNRTRDDIRTRAGSLPQLSK